MRNRRGCMLAYRVRISKVKVVERVDAIFADFLSNHTETSLQPRVVGGLEKRRQKKGPKMKRVKGSLCSYVTDRQTDRQTD